VLSRRGHLLVWTLVLGVAGGAWAQDGESDTQLRRPVRLTVGGGEQFLGQLLPDGKKLIFVSNRNTATEIYVEDTEEGRDHLLFDEGADATWPRVSPDGKSLLYVSFRDRASGQLCVRDLPEAGDRRCLDDAESALQAEWIDSGRIALVSRASIQGDLRLLEVRVDGSLSARPLQNRNLTSPSVSPDGRWLVYVPIERSAEHVGPGFAARASTHLAVLRLDRPNAEPVPIALDLPGQSGQPVFSRDGKWLYVVQFFTDSNRDGVIDGADRGVLFRVPFPTDRDDAPAQAAAAMPDQLTDASWSCEYPAPAATALVATCARGESLDVYQLPLDGEVPGAWSLAQVQDELALATRPVDQLLLFRQQLARETTLQGKREVTLRLAQLHLTAEDFGAAEFYADQMKKLRDRATAGLTSAMHTLIAHRSAERDRENGRMLDDFHKGELERLGALNEAKAKSPAAVALRHIIRSEIQEGLGDFAAARAELAAAVLDDETPKSVLRAYFERADELYRALDDRDALVAALRKLAGNGALTPDEQLDYAWTAVRALQRGRSLTEADAALVKEAQSAPAGSELAFALELGRKVSAVRGERPSHAVRDALLALYHQQTRPGRKRAVALDGAAQASDQGADGIIEALANAYFDDTKPGTEEHRRAERLYRKAIIGRAYRRRAHHHLDKAQADFDAVTLRTGSLESAVEAVNLRLRAKETPEQIEKEVVTTVPARVAPVANFVKAYVIARELAKLEGAAHDTAVKEARAALKASWPQLKNERLVQALYGAILHEDFLRSGTLSTAERANKHYMIALDLVRKDVRERAMILGQLGILHTQVGNYHIALGYLDQREKLPYVDNGAGLAVRLARARALLHVGREAEAAQTADQALAMAESKDKPYLKRYFPVAVDRAALYNLAAGNFERALALYDRELPELAKAPADPVSVANLLRVRLARCAAALGARQPQRALADLDVVDRELKTPAVLETLRWPHATAEQVHRSYRLIAAGLRANAQFRLGKLDDASQALQARRALFLEQLSGAIRDEDVRALSLAETHLAANAMSREDPQQAARWLAAALEHADTLVERTHVPADPGQLDVLWFAAELHTSAKARLAFDLPKRLDQAQRMLERRRNPAWRSYKAWFEIYRALMMDPKRPAAAAASP